MINSIVAMILLKILKKKQIYDGNDIYAEIVV